MKQRFNLRAMYVPAAFSLLLLSACTSHKDNTDERQPYVIPDSLARTLKVDTATTSNVTDALKFNGMVDFDADKVANIYPLVSGTASGITVMPGDYVKAGQVLGTVSSSEMANFSSSLVNAEAQVTVAKKQLDQQKQLYNSGLASQVDITTAQANYTEAEAALIAAKRVLSVNGNNTNGKYLIKTPVPGFVVQKNVNNGTNIRTDNNAPLFVVSDLQSVWVQANVYEENISKVHNGDTAEVSTVAYPDKVFKGVVNRVMNVLDPTTKVMKIRVVLNNPGYLLKPQMFATVAINNTESQQATTVASSALIFDHSQYYVIVLHPNNKPELRGVDVISINGSKAYIRSGVKPGDRLVASDAILIYGSLNS
ncbi:efflux RND transporter periplasmic adaptor subunit [Mucilaginibacter sp. 21P]|uniref:efflux RND transporter periplasmic adaptor subunit n=1 Tax=Mucilaginibacter sp. 21P TaxID=2778902 RepID=UPI001C56F35F|nr:efflux RND transporter periplasmic adaptor subunit [Mucilaginibacter sp. 21P]QXV64248.1 efflux RND transporter periplasmic adaptor subunit [Mucilaginibacter sp. 21P]